MAKVQRRKAAMRFMEALLDRAITGRTNPKSNGLDTATGGREGVSRARAPRDKRSVAHNCGARSGPKRSPAPARPIRSISLRQSFQGCLRINGEPGVGGALGQGPPDPAG